MFLSTMMSCVESSVVAFSNKVPLETFAFIGSIVEEVVAPIPSPLVMATAGSISAVLNKNLSYLLLISAISTIGKTIGCLIFYTIAAKAQDIFSPFLKKFFGITDRSIERISRYFDGTYKDDIILAILRAIPIMPSTPISLGCGFIKLNLITFIRSTLIGAYIRSFIFLYLGYIGAETLAYGFDSISSIVQIIIAVLLVVMLGLVYYNRGKKNLLKSLAKKIKSKTSQ